MKKVVVYKEGELSYWAIWVKAVLPVTEIVTFNILFQGKELDEFRRTFTSSTIEMKSQEKFHPARKILTVPIEQIKAEILNQLEDFSFWKNKCVEDPSFWTNGSELLACITHENLIMVDDDYFVDEIRHLDLLNHTTD